MEKKIIITNEVLIISQLVETDLNGLCVNYVLPKSCFPPSNILDNKITKYREEETK